MKLFLDCEFNGFGGELISLALVDENGRYFYEVLEYCNTTLWVSQHVIPKLGQSAISDTLFKNKLSSFLNQYERIHVIADWPEDLSLFARSLIISAGHSMVIPPLTMELWMNHTPLSTLSTQPHNALSDAQALYQAYLTMNVYVD